MKIRHKSDKIPYFCRKNKIMYDILVRSHSGLRWIALILLVVAIVNALGARTKGIYVKKDKMINLFAMVFIHVQVTLGLIMYFQSPRVNFVEGWMKSPQLRFFGMEQIAMMILAAVLLTIGRKKAEKESNPNNKHRKIFMWYTICLVIIFLAIPWPFRQALGITTWM